MCVLHALCMVHFVKYMQKPAGGPFIVTEKRRHWLALGIYLSMSPGRWVLSPPLFILVWINVTDYLTDESVFFFFIEEEVRLPFFCLGDYRSIASCSIVMSIPNERVQSLLPSSGLRGGGPRVTCALIGSCLIMSHHWVFSDPCRGEVCLCMNEAHASLINSSTQPWRCSDAPI